MKASPSARLGMRGALAAFVLLTCSCARAEPRRPQPVLPHACATAPPELLVLGEVLRPGKQVVRKPVEVTVALKRAGGFTRLAWRMTLQRTTCTSMRTYVLPVRDEAALRGVILEPGDVLLVGASD